MELVKVRHGLLEEENFYLTSSAMDFLGEGAWSRTETAFRLWLGDVKRRLPYREFVIDVKKEPAEPEQSLEFFLESEAGRLGLREEAGEVPATDWRIICTDGFVQIYASTDDGQTWNSKGGTDFSAGGEIFQGFAVKGSRELVITDYKVFAAPYLTIQNFPPGTLARLTDIDGNILERFFDENYECKIFLGRSLTGVIQIYENGDPVYESPEMAFAQGDIYLFASDMLRLVYKGVVLDYQTTSLDHREEILAVRNTGNDVVSDVNVGVVNSSNGTVELSLDTITWGAAVNVGSLAPDEEKSFHMKTARAEGTGLFGVMQYELEIY